MNFIIISGQSGAGKSQAKKVFEDFGYYCIDNLPPSLIPNFIELLEQNSEGINNIALVIDIRGGKFFKDLEDNLKLLTQKNYDYRIFYFEANDEVLIKRFKETRRSHPLDPSARIETCIEREKEILSALKEDADFVINTGHMTQSQLKKEISRFLEIKNETEQIAVTVMSFGFKKGVPLDSDYVFDVRFLPNPYYIEELRPLTGNDLSVRDYVMSFQESNDYLDRLKDLLEYAVPMFVRDGRSQLVISVGCTGGQHRSVTFANALSEFFKNKGYNVVTVHRDAK
ncbi:RNase adapter RapZ [Fusibacter ferrireducens]|uniref:RNase adapter RapZ n=1 Tax=Fusibacter ferrireducens TaxID=2785058 RepID=A0ABR9ZY73_9FIRM|nr:RNase adapter RapZ [Fusibacter ferrireducens]MBF4695402.1 RNase adapter RapZ [Fusibacter ferrireducens]